MALAAPPQRVTEATTFLHAGHYPANIRYTWADGLGGSDPQTGMTHRGETQ